MNRKLLLLLTLFISVSCSVFEQVSDGESGRNISSISTVPLNGIKTNEDEESIRLSGTVRAFGKRDGYNSFSFPLLNLESPFYDEVPYTIIVSSVNVECFFSKNIVQEGYKNVFRINKYEYGDYFRCTFVGEGEGFFNFVYVLPKLKTFSVSEAEYMKGFTPDIVTNMELSLAKIYEKLVPKEGGAPEALYYRERELLLKYVPDVVDVTLDPKEFKIQFETELEDQDLFVIDNISGELTHNKWGKFSYDGYDSDDYLKYHGAGAKYLRSFGVKPFGLYCIHSNQSFNFEYVNKLEISDAGKIECSINARKSKFLGFRAPKGEVSAQIKIMRISKAKKLLPKYFLNKAKKSIENKINEMNKNNTKRFSNKIKREIKNHEKDIVDMLTVDKSFPFNKDITVKHLKTIVFNKPIIRIENKGGKDFKYITYRVFYRNLYRDSNEQEFRSSDIYMGEVKTNMIYANNKKISNFYKVTEVNHDDYIDTLEGYLNEHLNSEDTVNYNSYTAKLRKYANLHKKYPRESEETTIQLSRFSLNICGKVYPKEDASGIKKENIVLNEFRARYDLFQAGSSSSFRSMYTDNFYYERLNLEKPIEIATPIHYSGKDSTKEQCYHISPREFATGSYEHSVALKNI